MNLQELNIGNILMDGELRTQINPVTQELRWNLNLMSPHPRKKDIL